MPIEREKMLADELYDPLDPDLVAGRDHARNIPPDTFAAGNAIRVHPRLKTNTNHDTHCKNVRQQSPFCNE